MTSPRRWTYNQITAAAEKQITDALTRADKNPGNYQLQSPYRSEARGAFDVWYATRSDGRTTGIRRGSMP
jgi:hypothetical protein